MLIGESKESNEDVYNRKGHEPDVGRVPSVVAVVSGHGHDVGQVLDDLLLKSSRNLCVVFVSNSVRRGQHIVGGLYELNRQGSECRRSAVGQLVGALDEALRKDPMCECSGHQIENSQRPFLSMWGSFSWGQWNRFRLEGSEDGFGGKAPRVGLTRSPKG